MIIPVFISLFSFLFVSFVNSHSYTTGRTGRLGKEGAAYSFVARIPYVIRVGGRVAEIDEEYYMKSIEKFINHQRQEARKSLWGPEAKLPLYTVNTPIALICLICVSYLTPRGPPPSKKIEKGIN